MKINLNKEELHKCDKLLLQKENNLSSVEILIEYLNNHNFDISIDMLDKNNLASSFCDAFFKILSIDKKDPYIKELIRSNKIDKFTILDREEYLNNPYVKAIKDINFNHNGYSLLNSYYKPYEAFPYDEIKVDDTLYNEVTPMGLFKNKFPFLTLIKDEEIWMSLIPHEIESMKKAIKDAYGNVLVFGLGLGYYPFMVSLKEEVNKITIVEYDQEIIDIFNKFIFPLFKEKEKITIEKGDALTFLNNKENKFDFVFTDIYHNVADGLPLYLKIKQFEKYNPYTTFSYWIEDSLTSMLRRQLLTIFEEQTKYNYSDKDYKIAKNENDKIINALYNLTKDYEINSYDDLHKLLEKENICSIIKNLEINF